VKYTVKWRKFCLRFGSPEMFNPDSHLPRGERSKNAVTTHAKKKAADIDDKLGANAGAAIELIRRRDW
jgi:hypothetical protein